MTRVAVIGGGKMGLPLACQFATKGASVIVCDIRPDIVDVINSGRCPINEPGIEKLLAEAVRKERLRATANTVQAVRDSDVVVVIVPALLTEDRDADLSVLDGVTKQIHDAMHEGLLISYETTVPVGTTRKRFLPMLAGDRYKVGRDFFLAFSPERVKSRLILEHLTKNPKVVGGVEPESTRRAKDFYEKYLGAPVVDAGSTEAAELVKLAGMLYRDVNIALSNELAAYAEASGIDFFPVIRAANTDGEAYLLQPGIGVGGHCTPVYPYFMIQDGRRRGVRVTLAEKARELNEGQPGKVLDRLERECGKIKGKKVLILGLGFRPQVKEHVCSPAFALRGELEKRGARVVLHDPLYDEREIRSHGFQPGTTEDWSGAEVVVLNTAHDEYRNADFAAMSAAGVKAVVDGRALWDSQSARSAGLMYIGVGRPTGV